MIWLLTTLAMAVVIAALAAKVILLRRAADEIRLALAEKLNSDTNTLITIASNDRAMRRLAGDLNVRLAQLRQLHHRFVQGDTELKNAVTNIAHDLRTPLTAISGYLELLERAEKSDTVARYIGVIRNRTELLSQLTEELFRYSVITSPAYDTALEPVDVNAVLEQSILEFYAALQERGITPALHLTQTRVVRPLNRASLSRVFANLLNNAVKYSDGDLTITLTAEGRITFANTVSGLSEVQVAQLFDRFYTVESARKSTGLGLSIARTLMEQMHGAISAAYRDGRLIIAISLPDAAA